MPNKQHIKIEYLSDEILILTFAGDIDAFTVSNFHEAITQETTKNKQRLNIVVNLERTAFIDSHAVGLFVSLLKRTNKTKAKLVFTNVTGQPKSILKIVGFNKNIVSYTKDIGKAITLLQA